MHHGGYDLVHAVMMMIPEPWERHTMMDEGKRRSTNSTPA
jgi:glutamate synthase domain-containing protein 1